jgi:hypothetical protein
MRRSTAFVGEDLRDAVSPARGAHHFADLGIALVDP